MNLDDREIGSEGKNNTFIITHSPYLNKQLYGACVTIESNLNSHVKTYKWSYSKDKRTCPLLSRTEWTKIM